MLTLILGGARSGKSHYAQALCEIASEVIYIATATQTDDDAEMQARIARHRIDRPEHWITIEEPLDIAQAIYQAKQSTALVIIDCITVWLSNLLWKYQTLSTCDQKEIIMENVQELTNVAKSREVIAVSNEVGTGIVPDNPVGRSFRDIQGIVNQRLARESEHVVFMIAGLPLTLKGNKNLVVGQ